MGGHRIVVLIGAAALVAPLAGFTAIPAAALGTSGVTPTAVKQPTSTCFPSQDNGDPVLKTFDFSPRAVDSRLGAQTVTFRATADDTGGPGAPSGVVGGAVFVSFDDSGNWNLRAPLKPDATGALVGTLTILPQFQTATRYVSLSIDDADGNSTLYSTSDLAQMGLPTTFTTTTTPDVARPVLRSLHLSTTTIDTRRHRRSLGVRLHVTDDSAVAEIRVFLYGSALRNTPAHPRLVAGTPADGTWVGRIRVPRWQGNSTAKIAVELTDVVGQVRTYGARRLTQIGQPSHVRIVSRTDPAAPTLRLRSVTPDSVDLTTGAQSVTFVVRVRDVGSGARRVELSLDGPEQNNGDLGIQTRLVRVSGTAHDGVWKGTATLRPCTAVAGPWRATVFARDAAQADYISVEDALRVLNADILRPSGTVVGDTYQVRRSGPVTIEFDEDVVGVGGDNALVHVGDSQRGRAGEDPTPIAGSWTCKSAAGAAVDCTAGPVRTAAFTPATPLLAGTNHTVLFNPEHHLGLTDLAGNPFPPLMALAFHTS